MDLSSIILRAIQYKMNVGNEWRRSGQNPLNLIEHVKDLLTKQG